MIYRAVRTHVTISKQTSLEKCFIFSIYQNCTLALKREKRLEYVYSHMQFVWPQRKCVKCVEYLITYNIKRPIIETRRNASTHN